MEIFITSYVVTVTILLGLRWYYSLKHYSFRYLIPSMIADVIGVALAGIPASAVVKVIFNL